jgi:hypothetical protein
MHGEILSFEVEPDGQHVIMTVSDPSEGQNITVRAAKDQLSAMAGARPFYSNGLPQTPTREPPLIP